MPLVKLFRITDTNGERWHIAAPSFSRAVEAMSDWENIPHESDDEIVRSVEVVEDLIHGGNRDEDMDCGHSLFGDPQKVYQPQNWTLANAMAFSINMMLKARPGDYAGSFADIDPEKFFAAIDAMKKAVDDYEEIPF